MRSLKETIKGLEKQMIINALRENDWIMARAARDIGITERMIGYKIKKHGIKKEVDRHETKADSPITGPPAEKNTDKFKGGI